MSRTFGLTIFLILFIQNSFGQTKQEGWPSKFSEKNHGEFIELNSKLFFPYPFGKENLRIPRVPQSVFTKNVRDNLAVKVKMDGRLVEIEVIDRENKKGFTVLRYESFFMGLVLALGLPGEVPYLSYVNWGSKEEPNYQHAVIRNVYEPQPETTQESDFPQFEAELALLQHLTGVKVGVEDFLTIPEKGRVLRIGDPLRILDGLQQPFAPNEKQNEAFNSIFENRKTEIVDFMSRFLLRSLTKDEINDFGARMASFRR